MSFAIHDPGVRSALDVRAKPYFIRIADGLHLGYRKGKSLSRWVVRTSIDGGYRTRTVQGIEPDDTFAADGIRILSFQQMVDRIMSEYTSKISCSFCGKDRDSVAKLVAGPGVFICDACIALCQLYIDHPSDGSKLLIEDGEPVLKEGKPIFVPLTEEERTLREKMLNAGY